MKISQLPQDIKELALKYKKNEINPYYRKNTDDLRMAFDWANTKENYYFWCEWDNKPIKLGDFLKLENRIIYLELKIEELINTLKNN
jgi:hypothetical protein